ncbi:MAG: methyltransferase domain-containing protein [Sterolibacterium sp.]|nr:methyltransferase domain-containing protein [Sterolibacterium sp.]
MSIKGFDNWLETPQGQYVLEWEQARFDLLVADIFGFKAMQLGLPQHDFLRANRMPFRLRCDDQFPSQAMLLAKPHFLPFANASVDLVILPHVLEFDAAPHQILREVERVLVPEGQVVVTGFNPFSLWGMRRKLSRADAPPPWRGQYLSVLRLKDWLALLGFETQAGSFGCYALPVTHEKWLHRWRFMELAGNRWWPYAGGTYIVQAIKRVHGMRLITPLRNDRKALAKSLAAVVQQSQTERNEHHF